MTCFLTSKPPMDPLTYTFTDENGFISGIKAALKDRERLLFICSDPHTYEYTELSAHKITATFADSGVSFSRMDVIDGRNADKAAELVSAADMIVLEGGHVPTQNRFFAEIRLKELLNGFDGVIMGISAGSMNSASTVYAQPEREGEAIDPNYERFLTGLGLTDIMMIPHYQEIKNDVLDGLRVFEDIAYPDSIGRRFYALVDGSYLLIKDGTQAIRGEAYLIEDGVLTQKAKVGDVIPV
ncbi:MAG: Type 1 glutamine amidotransferase-like domain-containing protein [Ruminococcus sp.]|nr:Type 1 glutamine amidotransferase-like domain-containing protein [Ruminococcus sp.]